MNEAQTRFNKIDPKLRDAGWGIVPGSKILVEQSAYIAPGRITTTGKVHTGTDPIVHYCAKNGNRKKTITMNKISQECDALKQAILRQVFE